METTYDVRIWDITVYKGSRVTTYKVRWKVGKREFKEPFRTRALADGFRSDLVSAARKGEAFDVSTGLPVSSRGGQDDLSWYSFACEYIDMKWPGAAATYRRSLSEALVSVTPTLMRSGPNRPDGVVLRSALHRFAFNTARRESAERSPEVVAALRWAESHSVPVSSLADPAVVRSVLAATASRIDGSPSAASVTGKRRRVLYNVFEYAVERKLLDRNPFVGVKRSTAHTPTSQAVDRRSVVNPLQARTLIRAVANGSRSRPRLEAFFGLMYFAAMRPEEAANVNRRCLELPAEGWGTIHLEEATPYAGSDWTDTGKQRDRRQLKNRPRGETRPVPSPPELTAILWSHLERFGTASDGRLFPGERAEELPKLTYMRAWKAARRAVFTEEVQATPLGATPYSLRHAAVSTWLNGGVDPTQVAEWAGHSVEMLLKVYAKCVDGRQEAARRRVLDALG